MKRLVLCVTTGALLATSPANGADQGWYAGAGAGQTTITVDEVLGSNYKFDENDVGFKLFGGYAFLPWLAVEGAYMDGGSPEVKFRASAETLNIDVQSIAGAAVFSWPVNERFELFVKPGFAYWMSDTKYTDPDFVFKQDDNGAAFFIGAGAGFYNGHAGLRIEYEWYKVAPEYDDTSDEFVTEIDGEAGFLSMSIVYLF